MTLYRPHTREDRRREGNAVGTLWDTPEAAAHARSTDPLPSHRAAREVVETGTLNAQCAEALATLREVTDLHGDPPTTAEMARSHGESDFHKYVRIYGKRLPDLRRRELVRNAERPRRCMVNGNDAMTWGPTEGTG